MVTVRVSADTPAPPEAVLAGAMDFSDRRTEIWPNVTPGHFEVHETGPDHVEATEELFKGFFFERCRYERTSADTVTATVIDSNVLLPGSTWTLTATPAEGGTHVETVLRREFRRGVRGALGWTIYRTLGKVLFGSDLRRALAAIARDAAAAEPRPAGDAPA